VFIIGLTIISLTSYVSIYHNCVHILRAIKSVVFVNNAQCHIYFIVCHVNYCDVTGSLVLLLLINNWLIDWLTRPHQGSSFDSVHIIDSDTVLPLQTSISYRIVVGETENARPKNAGRSKMHGRKTWDWKTQQQTAGLVNAGIGIIIITTVTEDIRETTFLFQRLTMAGQRGNAVSFHNTVVTE